MMEQQSSLADALRSADREAGAECDPAPVSAEGSQNSSRPGSGRLASSGTGSDRPMSARRSDEAVALVKARYQRFMATQILLSNLVRLR